MRARNSADTAGDGASPAKALVDLQVSVLREIVSIRQAENAEATQAAAQQRAVTLQADLQTEARQYEEKGAKRARIRHADDQVDLLGYAVRVYEQLPKHEKRKGGDGPMTMQERIESHMKGLRTKKRGFNHPELGSLR